MLFIRAEDGSVVAVSALTRLEIGLSVGQKGAFWVLWGHAGSSCHALAKEKSEVDARERLVRLLNMLDAEVLLPDGATAHWRRIPVSHDLIWVLGGNEP
jgi:hypothetical protein